MACHGSVEQLDQPVVTTNDGRMVPYLSRVAVNRYQVLSTTEIERGSVEVLACSDPISLCKRSLRHVLLRRRGARPFAWKRPPAGNSLEDPVHVHKLEPAFESDSHHAGMQDILVVADLQEIVENPVLAGAWSLFAHPVASRISLRRRNRVSKPVEGRSRVDQDLSAQLGIRDPVADGVNKVPVIGIDFVFVRMGPVRAPHNALGCGLDQRLGHGFDIVIGWKVGFTDPVGPEILIQVLPSRTRSRRARKPSAETPAVAG